MSQETPCSIDQYIQQKVATGEFPSAEAFAREAIAVYRELESRHAPLKAEVQQRIAQVERGEVGPIDFEAIKARGRARATDGTRIKHG